MKITWLITLFAASAATGTTTADEPETSVFECAVTPPPVTPIDKLVAANLAKLGVQPLLCSDAVFVRRAFLDVIGTLPTAQEARDFIQDADLANKRRKLIDSLLDRPEFADFWAMRWGDVLRIKAEFPVNLWPNAAQAYHGRHRRRRGPDIDGNAHRNVAGGPSGRHGGVFLPARLQTDQRMEGRACVLGSVRLQHHPRQYRPRPARHRPAATATPQGPRVSRPARCRQTPGRCATHPTTPACRDLSGWENGRVAPRSRPA